MEKKNNLRMVCSTGFTVHLFVFTEKRHRVCNELGATDPDEKHQPGLGGQHSGRAQPTQILCTLFLSVPATQRFTTLTAVSRMMFVVQTILFSVIQSKTERKIRKWVVCCILLSVCSWIVDGFGTGRAARPQDCGRSVV